MGDPFKPLTDFGKNMEKGFGVFKEIGERLKRIKYGFDDIGNGIKNEFKGLGDGLNIGVTDIGRLLEYVFIFTGSYINCGVHFLKNLKGCIFYYLMEALGQILYLPVRFVIWLLKVCKLGNMQPYADKLWTYVEKGDKLIYNYANMHISHYPKSVRQTCYVCRRLKQRVIVRQGDKVNDDFSKDGAIAQEFAKGINQMKDGGKNINSALTEPF